MIIDEIHIIVMKRGNAFNKVVIIKMIRLLDIHGDTVIINLITLIHKPYIHSYVYIIMVV